MWLRVACIIVGAVAVGERIAKSAYRGAEPLPQEARPIEEFNYLRYETSHEEIKGWLDPIYGSLPGPIAVTSTLLGIIPFAVGLLLSVMIDFEKTYLFTLPVYLGAFGVAWTAGVIRYASRRVHRCYAQLRPCFLVTDEAYKHLISRWLRVMWSRKANALVAVVLLALGALAVWAAFFDNGDLVPVQLQSLRPSIFGAAWFDGDGRNVKALIILIYGTTVAFLLGPAARMLVCNFIFLLRLRCLPVLPAANVIRARLRGATNFYMTITFSWFVGVGLFGVVFLDVYDWGSVTFLVTLSVLGTLTFLTPQVVFRTYLASSYRLACDVALAALNDQMGILLCERVGPLVESSLHLRLPVIETFGDVISSSSRPFRLVYDLEDVLVLIFGQAVTIGVFVLQWYLG